jgi:hypothetical protein
MVRPRTARRTRSGSRPGPASRSPTSTDRTLRYQAELKAQAGRRDELRSVIERLAARDRPSGYGGSTYYESLDDPDLLVDIADWASPEARASHLASTAATGAYAPALALLAGPIRATVIRRLP